MFTRPGTVARLSMMTTSWFCAKCDRPQGGSSSTVRCERVCKVRADEAGPAGDDVAHEEIMRWGGLGVSELSWAPVVCQRPGQVRKNASGFPLKWIQSIPLFAGK